MSSSVSNIRRLVVGAVVAGSIMIGAPAAFASTHAVKAGAACTKAEKGKTEKSGKTTYECKLVGKKYKWEVK